MAELVPFECKRCKRHIVHALATAKVRCPKCGRWISYTNKK